MPSVPYGVGAYQRVAGSLPEVRLRNLFLEQTPANQLAQVVLLGRPSLTEYAPVGDGPIRGMSQKDGSFGGAIFAVSGTELYEIDATPTATLLGTIAGTERVSMASDDTRLIIANGTSSLYLWNGATLTTIPTPDSRAISYLGYLNGYFIMSEANQDRLYWVEPGATTLDPLSFKTAERSSDPITGISVTGDEIFVFGSETVEVYVPTGNANDPFQRVNGRLFEKGCIDETNTSIDNTAFWVGADGIVYRADAGPIRISDHGIEERIQGSDPLDMRAWAFTWVGHQFYCLRLTDSTWIYDAATQQWSEWLSYDGLPWKAHLGVMLGGAPIAGDDVTGTLWLLEEGDADGTDPIIDEWTAGVPLLGARQPCSNLRAFVAAGEGAGVAQVRWSDDQGRTWSDYLSASMGAIGEYSTRVRWRRLGQMKPPGRVFQFRVTRSGRTRVSAITYNEAF